VVIKTRQPSVQTLALLAVVLPLFAVLSTWASLGCSEGACGIAATLLAALWLPIILAWLAVLAMLVQRWFTSRR
jgi:hypothetical protein